MVGNIFDDVPFSFRNMYKKEAQLKTVFRYRNTYPMAIEAVASGKINLKSIISAEYDFDHAQDAFDRAVDDKLNCVKVVIHVQNEWHSYKNKQERKRR